MEQKTCEKKNRVELVFILDRSGSMAGLEADTIGGYNSMLAKQKAEAGEVTVTTVLFDDRYELIHDRMSIHDIAPLTEREYYVRGCTALLDAIGKTISKIGNAQKYTLPERRADKVLFVITTDGMENSSREFSRQQIRSMVEHQKQKYGWEFFFFGANIDAISTAERFGISADRAVTCHADAEGTALNYDTFSNLVSAYRCCSQAPVGAEWKKRIEQDFKSRKSKR